MTAQDRRFGELEGLRGLAALLIVAYHMPKWHAALDIGIVDNAYLAVDLFFVLSGFVIHAAYADRIASGADFRRFMFLRFARLYPLHLLFLAVFVAIEAAKYVAQTRYGIVSPNSQPFRENSFTALIQNLLLVHAIGPTGNATTFNYQSWSISVEFYVYAAFAAIVLATNRTRPFVFVLIVFCAAMPLLFATETYEFSPLLRCLVGFFAGCSVARLIADRQATWPAWSPVLAGAALVLFVAFKPGDRGDAIDILIYPLSAATIVTLVLAEDGGTKAFLRTRHVQTLGALSYAIYMSHSSVIWFANQIVRFGLRAPETIADGRAVPRLTGPQSALAIFAVAVAILALAALVHRRVEMPVRAWSRGVMRS